jgi:hypothetical protein
VQAVRLCDPWTDGRLGSCVYAAGCRVTQTLPEPGCEHLELVKACPNETRGRRRERRQFDVWLRCTLRRRVGRICAFYGVSLWRCVSSGAMGVLAGAGVCSSSSEWAGRRRAQQCDMQTHVLYCMVSVLARRLWCEVRLRGWVSRIEQSSLRAASHRQFPTLAGRALCGMLCFAVP